MHRHLNPNCSYGQAFGYILILILIGAAILTSSVAIAGNDYQKTSGEKKLVLQPFRNQQTHIIYLLYAKQTGYA